MPPGGDRGAGTAGRPGPPPGTGTTAVAATTSPGVADLQQQVTALVLGTRSLAESVDACGVPMPIVALLAERARAVVDELAWELGVDVGAPDGDVGPAG